VFKRADFCPSEATEKLTNEEVNAKQLPVRAVSLPPRVKHRALCNPCVLAVPLADETGTFVLSVSY